MKLISLCYDELENVLNERFSLIHKYLNKYNIHEIQTNACAQHTNRFWSPKREPLGQDDRLQVDTWLGFAYYG